MNPWPVVVGAYLVAIVGTGGLIAWAGATMRRAERAADSLRRK